MVLLGRKILAVRNWRARKNTCSRWSYIIHGRTRNFAILAHHALSQPFPRRLARFIGRRLVFNQ
jgi:hypothetical protein